MRVVPILCLFVALSGCASVGTIMTGPTFPAIQPEQVKLYSNPPRQYQEVALVTSQAGGGWTTQGQVDNAIAGLRKKAASLGANGVLIELTGATSAGAVAVPTFGGGFIMADTDAQTVKGRLIHVTEE